MSARLKVLAAVAVVLVLPPVDLQAAFHKLNEPSLAIPEGFSESARTRIMASLRRADCKFIGGYALNMFTSLQYQGDTLALNHFLEGLAKCPGVALSVRFQRRGVPADCDWLVSHLAGKPGNFTVHVNLESSQIDLQDLVIPQSKGPPLSEAE